MADVFYNSYYDYSISSADVETNVHNLHDRNFDTIYEVTGAKSGTKEVWIDRGTIPISGSYPGVTHIGITFYSGSFVHWGNSDIHIYQNVVPSETGQVGLFDGILGNPQYLNQNTQLWLRPVTGVYNMRYIRIKFVGFSNSSPQTDPKVTQVMLLNQQQMGRNYTIDKSYQYPVFYTDEQDLIGPKGISYSNFGHSVEEFRRHWPLVGTADINKTINIFKNFRGKLFPFLYVDGLTGVTYLCKSLEDKLDSRKYINFQFDEVTFDFREIYKIKSGFSS